MGQKLVATNFSDTTEEFGCGGRRRRWGCHRFSRRAHEPTHPRYGKCCARMRDGERPLSSAEAGTTVKVLRVFGDEEFRSRMMAMGIVPGASISIVSGGAKQPLLIALTGCRFVIDRTGSEMIAISDRQPVGETTEGGGGV